MLSFHLAFRSYAGSICIFCSAQHWKQPYTRLQISVNIISYSADVLKFTYLSILSMLILGNFFYFCWSSWISVFCGKCSGYSLLCLEKSKVSFFIQTSEWLLPFFLQTPRLRLWDFAIWLENFFTHVTLKLYLMHSFPSLKMYFWKSLMFV